MSDVVLRLGVAGLGRAFMIMLPTLRAHPGLQLVAAADPRPEARAAFERDLGGRAYPDVDTMCGDADVQAVYVATPHERHAEHVVTAAAHGKHVLVEKPLAITLGQCEAMIDAARRAGVALVVGHSHSFDAPYARTRALVESGAYGEVRMIAAQYYTDFVYRPRRPEELDTAQGGGVVFSQAAHQVDVVRLLGGGRLRSVRACCGAWDPARATEGAYAALLAFESGAFASLVYSGYAHFDSDELAGWIGELGGRKNAGQHAATRAALASTRDEAAAKMARAYGGERAQPPAAPPVAHNHFGSVIVSCTGADLRPLPDGIMIYDDHGVHREAIAPPAVPRAEVIDELRAAALEGRAPMHSGAWAMATLEACLALLESSRTGAEVVLRHQVPVPARNEQERRTC
jgi:phthalate 4,5-cis-dihydrodiol dehydrogenase